MSPVTVELDNISFQLQQEHRFDWLEELGTVFTVFDQQDSGNISFGIIKHGIKRFVKYAGAQTLEYYGDPQDAIENLKRAMPIYEDLKHDHLITLVEHFETQEGYAAVFEWVEGESLHPHWSFPPPAKYDNPNSPYYRYRQLPIEARLSSLDGLFSFHVNVEKMGYVAVDFYDGSILYDFDSDITKICDIDLYQNRPFINNMGRLWGSSRFMSPEEFEYGAVIDHTTNVFNMGAVAFALVGGELDRSFTKWEAGIALYNIAVKAIDPNRKHRFSSVSEFYEAWKYART
ncbi:serine/threonine protein kinase [Paenibacillus macquariensis subsp. defensor]|nr:serine/threonine protein kinase [Paenibacillus macquariensis subsp. defensor]